MYQGIFPSHLQHSRMTSKRQHEPDELAGLSRLSVACDMVYLVQSYFKIYNRPNKSSEVVQIVNVVSVDKGDALSLDSQMCGALFSLV